MHKATVWSIAILASALAITVIAYGPGKITGSGAIGPSGPGDLSVDYLAPGEYPLDCTVHLSRPDERVRSLVDQSRTCDRDSDCEVLNKFQGRYIRSVNRAQMPVVIAAIDDMFEAGRNSGCRHFVQAWCDHFDSFRPPCENNICVVISGRHEAGVEALTRKTIEELNETNLIEDPG